MVCACAAQVALLLLVAAPRCSGAPAPSEHSHHHATSYQNFNLESYHPVPVYKKHEEHELMSHHVTEPIHKSSAFELESDFGGSAGLEHGHGEGEGVGVEEGSHHFLHGEEASFAHLGDIDEGHHSH